MQAMRLVTEVAQLRTSPAGASVGYGATWRAARDEPRRGAAVSATPTACRAARAVTPQVAIRGKRVPLVGRDLDGHRDRRRHRSCPTSRSAMRPCCSDARAAARRSRAAEYGGWAGLSEYEVTCGMCKRVPRTYVEARVSDRRRRRDDERRANRARPRRGAERRRRRAGAAPPQAPAPSRRAASRRSRGAVVDRRQGCRRAGLQLPRRRRRPPDHGRARVRVAAAPAVPRRATTSRRSSTSASAACRSSCSSACSPAMVTVAAVGRPRSAQFGFESFSGGATGKALVDRARRRC